MPDYFRELRRKVGKEMILVPGTGAIVLSDEGHVLLMLRSDTEEWGLPGGFMDLGETVRQSLRRELREELGLESSAEELVGIYAGPEFETTHQSGERTSSVTVLFVVREHSGAPRNSSESREVRFFPPDALPEPMTRSSARFLHDYFTRRDGSPTIL